MGLAAWKDDPQTEEQEGYVDGASLSFRVRNTAGEVEARAVGINRAKFWDTLYYFFQSG